MKEMLSKALNTKQTTQIFLVNNKKNNNNLTVFEPKALLGGFYETGAIPLSQTATFNIKCLKWDLKDSPNVWT